MSERAKPAIQRLIDGLDEHWLTTDEGKAAVSQALEAVAAAVEAMRSACATCSPYAAEKLYNAIAGLTGGEVQHD